MTKAVCPPSGLIWTPNHPGFGRFPAAWGGGGRGLQPSGSEGPGSRALARGLWKSRLPPGKESSVSRPPPWEHPGLAYLRPGPRERGPGGEAGPRVSREHDSEPRPSPGPARLVPRPTGGWGAPARSGGTGCPRLKTPGPSGAQAPEAAASGWSRRTGRQDTRGAAGAPPLGASSPGRVSVGFYGHCRAPGRRDAGRGTREDVVTVPCGPGVRPCCSCPESPHACRARAPVPARRPAGLRHEAPSLMAHRSVCGGRPLGVPGGQGPACERGPAGGGRTAGPARQQWGRRRAGGGPESTHFAPTQPRAGPLWNPGRGPPHRTPGLCPRCAARPAP